MKNRIVFHTNQLVGIYSDSSKMDSFLLGYVCMYDSSHCLLHTYNRKGKEEGYICIKRKSVARLDYISDYVKQMKLVLHETNERIMDIQNGGGRSVLESIINFCQKEKKVVSLEICNSGLKDVHGIIRAVNREQMLLALINQNGDTDGEAIIINKWISKLWWE